MRVVVTGGSGLIGRALAAELLSGGHEVIVLSRRAGEVGELPDGVDIVQWDGRTGEEWSGLIEDAAIVNLAGASLDAQRWTAEHKRAIRESRVRAGQAVVAATKAASAAPRVVVQASAVGYYGSRGDEVLTEESGAGDDFLARVCVDWEASTAPVEAMGVRRVVIRTAPVLTMSGGVLPRLTLPFRFFVGGRLGSGRQWFPWIHVADEVRAIRSLIENGAASGPFNLAAPTPATNADLARTLGEVMRRPSILPVPAFALRLVLGEMAVMVLGSQRVVPARLESIGFSFQFPELKLALQRELG